MVLLALLAVFGLAACRVDVDVVVEAESSGRGEVEVTVSLDRAVLVQVPDLAEQLRVEDLLDAGWRIEGPTPTPDGGAKINASKAFSSAEAATAALAELSGNDGPFSSLRLRRSATAFTTAASLSGRIDLSDGLAALSDPELQERLGGLPLGVDPAALEREFGVAVGDVFRFGLSTRLPGRQERVEARLGEVVAVSVSSEQWNLRRVIPVALSLTSLLALVVVLFTRWLRGRYRPSHSKSS